MWKPCSITQEKSNSESNIKNKSKEEGVLTSELCFLLQTTDLPFLYYYLFNIESISSMLKQGISQLCKTFSALVGTTEQLLRNMYSWYLQSYGTVLNPLMHIQILLLSCTASDYH